MESKLSDQIKTILDEELEAEEQTFFGDPACPIVTGKDKAIERLVKLLSKDLVDALKATRKLNLHLYEEGTVGNEVYKQIEEEIKKVIE